MIEGMDCPLHASGTVRIVKVFSNRLSDPLCGLFHRTVPRSKRAPAMIAPAPWLLEHLEPRLLLSAAPAAAIPSESLSSEAVPMEVAISPAGSHATCSDLFSLDIDDNGAVEANTDGKLLLHYLVGTLKSHLTNPGALGQGAVRSTEQAIRDYLDPFLTAPDSPLDIDGNGITSAFTDGRLVYRFLQGLTGSQLIAGSVLGANAQRIDAQAIIDFLTSSHPGLELTPPLMTAQLQSDTGLLATDGVTFNPAIVGSICDINLLSEFRAGFDLSSPESFVDIMDELQDGRFLLTPSRLAAMNGGTLDDGLHTLHVRATDTRGVTAQVDLSFILDTIAPSIVAVSPGVYQPTSLSFTVTSSESLITPNLPATDFSLLVQDQGQSAIAVPSAISMDSPLDQRLTYEGLQSPDRVTLSLPDTLTDLAGNGLTGPREFSFTDRVTLVDFGPTAGEHLFGPVGWTQVLHDATTGAVAAGPGGMSIVTGEDGTLNFQGIQGSPRNFAEGARIFVTWFNNSETPVTFTPAVSFDDPDRRLEGAEGTWTPMSQTTLGPGATGTSELIVPTGLAGPHGLININAGSINQNVLVCDKVELSNTWTPAFVHGARVSTQTIPATIHSVPLLTGQVLATISPNSLGTVAGRPIYNNQGWWWHVQFDHGELGWIGEARLFASGAPLPTDPFTVTDVTTYATPYSIGIEAAVLGDLDHDGQAAVQFRPVGDSEWAEGLPLLRVDYNGANTFAGSLMFLTPNTAYEVQLAFSDPDGASESRLLTLSTLPEPTLPTGGRTFHVIPGTGGGTGTAQDPFRSPQSAEAAAAPGDIFLLHAGDYGSRPYFTKPGSPGQYIVWKSAGDGPVLFNGIGASADYLWFEGLTIHDEPIGIDGGVNVSHVVITQNTITNTHYGIFLNGNGSRGWTITDNVIVGDNTVESGSFDGDGIELNGNSDHVIAYNRISSTGDGLSTPGRNVDIFGNDIFNTSDDGIESDYGYANVRIWGNRITNAYHNGISFQPMNGAPWYLIRNQIINNQSSAFKFVTSDRFVLYHNTVVNFAGVFDPANEHLLNAVSRNNLFISATSGAIWDLANYGPTGPTGVSWKTDLDYDGFAWGNEPAPFGYATMAYPDLALFSAATSLERHGVSLTVADTFASLDVTAPPPASVAFQQLTLKPGSPAIDAGVPLPSINRGFLGTAPDLGAFEFGAAPLDFGPRHLASLSGETGSNASGPSSSSADVFSAIVTTSASPIALALPDDSSAASPLASSDVTTDAADALVHLTDVRADPRFAQFAGQGMRVAVIDTGADLDHPFFGPDTDGNGVADRIVYQFDFGDNDADANDRSGHGTHVTSLIASENTGFLGVAPDVELIILKVFGDTGAGSFGNLEEALQWVLDNAEAYNIGVVNMSLGDSQNWSEPVALYGIDDELAALAAQHVIAVSAAGNNFFTFGSTLGVAYPAADANVLAAGAVWSANFGGPFRFSSGAVDNTTGPDRIASFSQRHPLLLDAFAPGARFNGAGLNGGTLLLQGTSQATAYLSGVAVLAQQIAQDRLGRLLSVEEFSELLGRTAETIIDGDDENDNVVNGGEAYARVNVLALMEELAGLPLSAAPDNYTLLEDGVLLVPSPGVLLNDIAIDLAALHALLVESPLHGTLVLQPNGSFTYTPNADYAGSDSFRYRAFDGVDFSEPTTVSLTILPENDRPTIVSTPAAAATVGNLYRYDPQVNDPDAGDRLTFSLVTAPAGMTIETTTGVITWTPAAAQLGPRSAILRVIDAAGLFAEQSFTVTVSPLPGDINRDGQIDRADLDLIMVGRGSVSVTVGDERDLDGDGQITVLDARKWLVTYLT